MPASSSRLTPGTAIRHGAYGVGTVVELPRSLLGDARCEFTIRGLHKTLPCKARDLTPVEPERPALRVVYSRDGVGAAS